MNDDLVYEVRSVWAHGRFAETDPVIDALFLFRGGTQFADVIDLLVGSFEDPGKSGVAGWSRLTDALATNAGLAFEVLLKSYVVAKGAEFSRLSREFGHDLTALLSAANQQGAKLAPTTVNTIQTIGADVFVIGSEAPVKWHLGYRYKRPGGHRLCLPEDTLKAVKEVHALAGVTVLEKLRAANLRSLA